MKKADIRLLAQARTGNEFARTTLGRRYLTGDKDIGRNIATGVDYLLQPSPTPATLRVLAESLTLNEFVSRGLLQHLETASVLRVGAALVKSAVWCLLTGGSRFKARQILEHARRGGSVDADQLIHATAATSETEVLTNLLCSSERLGLLSAVDLTVSAARMHWQVGARGSFAQCVRAAASIDESNSDDVGALVSKLLELARDDASLIEELPSERLLEHLDRRIAAEDPNATHLLGLALSGMSYGRITPAVLGTKQNVRRGAALLLRAAHLGAHTAWLDLHHTHSDNSRSVASAEMARFCLEMAAKHGIVQAQRKLGSLLLRDATGMQDLDAAVAWLHRAHAQGDALATTLLRSLVVPVSANESAARLALHSIADKDPLLAARLRLARALGLTMHEALSIDPVDCLRPWGLLVGQSAHLRKRRMSAGRAIPALDEHAVAELRGTVSLFAGHSSSASTSADVDFRKRYFRLRYMMKLVGATNDLFFASLSAARRESLAGGRTWASRVRPELELALSTAPAQLPRTSGTASSIPDVRTHPEAIAA